MQKSIGGIVVVVVFVGVLGFFLYQVKQHGKQIPEPIACTTEALLCPDGSAVGRSGLDCVFTPCPDQPSYTGTLVQEGGAFVLDIPSVAMAGERFTLPLELSDVGSAQALVGRVVVVTGTFKEGSTLAVATLTPTSELDESIGGALGTLKVGDTKRVKDIQIALDEVFADSRCPTGVQCVAAGNVRLLVTFMNDSGSEMYEIHSDESPHPFGASLVSVADVTPVPAVPGETIDQSEYRVTFRVESRQAPSPIETYLHEHIAELSSASPVLGGTFYVTAVSVTSDTTAVVDYEDGHIAFTADVVFSMSPSGEVSAVDFRVRRQ